LKHAFQLSWSIWVGRQTSSYVSQHDPADPVGGEGELEPEQKPGAEASPDEIVHINPDPFMI
jgi:hypothetical protein